MKWIVLIIRIYQHNDLSLPSHQIHLPFFISFLTNFVFIVLFSSFNTVQKYFFPGRFWHGERGAEGLCAPARHQPRRAGPYDAGALHPPGSRTSLHSKLFAEKNALMWEIRQSIMVFILDGCSFHYAHTWSKSGISICWRHLVTSKESSNPIFFSEKDLVYIIRAQREMSNHLI